MIGKKNFMYSWLFQFLVMQKCKITKIMRWGVLELGRLLWFLCMCVEFTSLFAFLRKQVGITSDGCSKEVLCVHTAMWESYPLVYTFFLPGVKSSKETAQRQIYLCEKWSWKVWNLTCWSAFALSNMPQTPLEWLSGAAPGNQRQTVMDKMFGHRL